MEKTFDFDIKRLIIEVLYRSWIIILAALLFAIGGFVYAKTQLVPIYTASVSLYVNNYTDGTQGAQKVNSSDLYTAQSLVQTYLAFLKTDRVLDKVAENLDGQYTADQLRGMLSASALKETEIFQIFVSCTDREKSAEIANVVATLAPGVIKEYIEGSSVNVVDYAKVPTMRSFPVYRKYAFTGGIIGGGIAFVIIVVLFLFNSKINDEEDITKLFTAPVIGKIPNFDSRGDSASSYKKYKYGYEYKQKDKNK